MTQFFFPNGNRDGSRSLLNLWQATEVHLVSDDECRIKLSDGQVALVSGKENVVAVIQAIREAIVRVEDLPKAPHL